MSQMPHKFTSPYPVLDPQNVPIAGNMMIEASAGTGKTYTITLLVLRLLLGVNIDTTPKKLPEILIVTFTNAATAELKKRIYARIVDLKLAFFTYLANTTDHLGGEDNHHLVIEDDALGELIEHYLALQADCGIESGAAISQAINILIEAEGAIDQASIFTIHAFSQRLLKENALDLGQSFSFELSTDLSALYREAVYHFWREECYPLDYHSAKMVSNYYGVPVSSGSGRYQTASLFSKIEALIRDPNLIEAMRFHHLESLQALLTPQYTHIESVKQRALTIFSLDDFIQMIDTVGLKKQSYRSDLVRKYHDAFMIWANSDAMGLFSVAEKFSISYMESRLSAKGDLGKMPEALRSLFEDLENIATFEVNALYYAASKVVKILKMLKRESGVLGFDDLLVELNQKTAAASEAFLKSLHLRYRAVMIDEFQDTDNLQLATFRRLFFDHDEIPFVMIGDPKQSIYGFRGADINAYLSMKRAVADGSEAQEQDAFDEFTEFDAENPSGYIYTLNTNYRSGALQVDAVNHLFGGRGNQNPFYQEDIPFIGISTPESAQYTALKMPDKPVSGMTFLDYIPSENELSSTKTPTLSQPLFRDRIAAASAKEIADMLNAGTLQTAEGERAVHPEDITILVRSGNEAGIIQSALRDLGLNAVYLSERNSVFDPEESIVSDLYLFLRSLVFKHERKVLMQSLGSVLYGFSVTEYEEIMRDPLRFESLLLERNELNEIWDRHGVLAMIRAFMVRENRLARMLALENGERYASDLFHLGELLQRETFGNGEALLLWLHDKMFGIAGSDGTEIRLESDFKTIQIMTIHKSKGLEFPVVFLPFGLFTTTAKSSGVYVDATTHARQYIFPGEATTEQAEFFAEEAIAEDIRLLYVALTRAKFHTYVGFTRSLSARTYEKNALSSLIGFEDETKTLKVHFDASIEYRAVTTFDLMKPQHPLTSDLETFEKTAAVFVRRIAPLWRFTSFSNLSYNAKSSYFTPLLEDELELEETADTALPMAESLFPKGAVTGNFIHALLEDYTPQELQDRALLESAISASFAHIVHTDKLVRLTDELEGWLHDIFHAALPLSQNLGEILGGRKIIKELEFIFPIENRIHKETLNAILNTHLSRDATEGLQFEEIEGFLRGFIDLFFEIDGRYYVADYKSNTLGGSKLDYHTAQMQHSIRHAHYDLQYLIYSVAVVKFLRNQKPDFDYDRDFGGVFYFYLRGMAEGEVTGVYYIKPPIEIVEQLIALFGENEEEDIYA